jgi:polyhydroxybutyrate depolymerase
LQNPNAETIPHNDQVREYISYIPNSYDGSTPVPVVFNFQGYSGNATNHMRSADMRTLADAENFILVYPQGSLLNGTSHWNALPPGVNNKSTADDFGFVEAMLQKIAIKYAVDASRVYACGYSNGGMLAYGLANYKSELIAAVASVSGTQLNFNAATNHPMPVLHIHGTSDAVIPYDGTLFSRLHKQS